MSPSAETARLSALLNSAVDAIISIRKDGTIESVNPAAAKLFQYSEAEFIGRNVKFLMPEPFKSEHDGYLRRYLETGERRIIGIGREVTGQRKDGSTFPMHLSVGRFDFDGETYFTGILHDLTPRKQADEMATRLGRVIEDCVNEIFVFDAETLKFISVNSGARRNLGYSRQELKDLTPVDIKPEYDRPEFEALIAPLLSGERELLQFETVHRRKDGSDYHVEVNLQLHRSERVPVFVAIILDITRRREAELALQHSQKMEAIGHLTGGVAHDFNNLLTVIVGNLELLEMRLKDKEQLDLLGEAQEAADLGARLTERLLAFARRSQLEPEIVDLNKLTLGLTDLLHRTLGETINLTTNFAVDLWPVRADISQVESSIVNLAVNARDAMPDGGKLVIETKNVRVDRGYAASVIGLKEGDYVSLAVTDTGHGMPAEVVEKVFEPFFTTKEVGRGTGLGLSMIYGFAKQSEGHVTAYSEVGVGSTISLYLPRNADGGMDAHVDDKAHISKAGGELILVVEDDERLRKLTLTRLKELGYRVLEAGSGPQALAVLESNPSIDLVFSDLVMPGGMSGYDLCAEMRRSWTGIRFLLTSGYAEELAAPHRLKQNGIAVLRKPYRQAALAQSIQRALSAQ